MQKSQNDSSPISPSATAINSKYQTLVVFYLPNFLITVWCRKGLGEVGSGGSYTQEFIFINRVLRPGCKVSLLFCFSSTCGFSNKSCTTRVCVWIRAVRCNDAQRSKAWLHFPEKHQESHSSQCSTCQKYV